MTVTDTATHLEFDCAHGDIQGALDVDSRGRFTALGTYVTEHGGPVRVDEAADPHPAIFDGTVQSTTLTLTIRLRDTGDLFGSFTLTHDVVGRVVKCLGTNRHKTTEAADDDSSTASEIAELLKDFGGRTRLALVTSAFRTPPEPRDILLVRLHIADASLANVPIAISRPKPDSSATSCGTDGHENGHISSGT